MNRLVYLDNAATTPVRPEVREAIAPYLQDEGFGNPSSAHRLGRTARAAVEQSRRKVADALDARPEQVVFTSGGTEADNLAVLGAAIASRSRGGPFRVAVCSIEHKAVLEAADAVVALGGESIVLPVDPAGRVELAAATDALASGIAVLSAMWVNNEVGILQDVAHLAQLCHAYGTLFHTDAVQAIGKVPCSLAGLPNTCIAVSGHKIGALKGTGALVLPQPDVVAPLIHGGGQQRGTRPGTENVIGIVALGTAVELAVRELDATMRHVGRLRDELEHWLIAAVPHIHVNGTQGDRAPHISSVSFPGIASDSLLMHLDLADVCCSSGSACNTGTVAPSHVLSAMGVPGKLATSAIRFSFAQHNCKADVERVVQLLPEIVGKLLPESK
ncbi:MAG: cysteine desulfurase [Gemmatimonadota bacterium]|nr:MAG: cysteine desulfurase [Gemmatimonadota bacterium]